MPRLYLVRHGRPEATFSQAPDAGLDKTGRAQAEAVAERLAPLGPLPIVVSPLRRTRETAAPLERRWACSGRIEPAVGEIPSPMTDPEAREKWNERARARATEFEARGLEVLSGRSREMREAMGHHASAQGLAHAARGMLAQTSARVIDGLPSIAVPTLVIVGDKDEPFVAPCEYMAKKIPGARLEVIRDAGHSSNLDQPEAFNRVFVEFLDSLPR